MFSPIVWLHKSTKTYIETKVMSRNDFMGNLPNLLNYKSKKCTFFSYLCSLNKKLYIT